MDKQQADSIYAAALERLLLSARMVVNKNPCWVGTPEAELFEALEEFEKVLNG